ncbi:uncharacterized protein BO95DRAFT_519211 [Aspergillus brunneoviolaceus CBS 621.78]|uniref:Uncharacterized protein n=1 Tax=Aspergillus brunneoviolaceus CBS 621.78 TaxID=1450534 RepID=A0ACD1FS86_9EURO|nr:hypothetical protein BO95DRAFT_519211 [Aspergillus brunneoviolaceus CBS 621.78]RAH39811.1 hypothetical protein BO95DRAFT_519211 [Aspergillus brunneoviolaceus CBS 621.78]
MRFSNDLALLSLAVLPAFASPVDNNQRFSISKRCCILCDNPYARCGANDKREAVETEEEALFGPVAKRCCVNCDVNRCKRDEEPVAWPAKRCCILCDNPYASCLTNDKREAVETLEEAVEEY